MAIDPDLQDLIVEIPSDTIQLAHDKDGLPRTDPKELPKDKDGAPDVSLKQKADPDQDAAKKVEDDLVAKLKRDREEALAERDAEKAARAQAEAERQAALERATKSEETVGVRTDQAMRAHWTTLHERQQNFASGLSSAKDSIGSIKREIKQASTDGDHDRLADLQEHLAEAVNAKNTYEMAARNIAGEIDEVRRTFESQKTVAPEVKPAEKKEAAAPVVTPDGWIENAKAYVGNDGAAWLKEHKEYVTDQKLNKKLLRFADEYADDHGQHALKSEAFRKALDEKFFPDEVEMAEETEVETPKPKTKSKTAAAPVSRSTNFFSSNNLNAAQVRLPPKLAKFVRDAGLNPTEYALGAVADIKAGKLPKNFLDPDYPHE